MKLIQPSLKYKQSFIDAVGEYQSDSVEDRRDDYIKLNIKELEANFPGYIEGIILQSSGQNLTKGYVPQTTFWLVDKDEYIGRVSIRHELTEFLRKEGGHIGYDIRPSKRHRV